MAKIIIKRKNSFCGAAHKFDVYLMNNYVGELKSGDILEIPVDVGSHTLFFKSKLKLNFGKSPDTSFEAVVNTTDEVVEIKSKFDMNGNFVVSYADNAPHIPTYASSINIESDKQFETSISNPANRLRCPKCGGYNLTPISETVTHGKDFNSSDACCGYLLCGPLGLLFGLSGKGKQVITNTYWICSDCGNKFKAQ